MASKNCVLQIPTPTLNKEIKNTVEFSIMMNDGNTDAIYADVFDTFTDYIKASDLDKAITELSNDDSELSNVFYETVATANAAIVAAGMQAKASPKQIGELKTGITQQLEKTVNAYEATNSTSTDASVETVTRVEGKFIPEQDGDKTTDGDVDADAMTENWHLSREDREEDLPPSDIIKSSGAKSMADVYSYYLMEEMAKYSSDLSNTFVSYVSKSWLATDADYIKTTTFDEQKIRDNIRDKAKYEIQRYYEKLSNGQFEFIYNRVDNKFNPIGSDIVASMMVFDDIKKLPPNTTWEGITMKFDEGTENEVEVKVYSLPDGIFPTEIGYAVVLPEGKTFKDVHEFLKTGVPYSGASVMIDQQSLTVDENLQPIDGVRVDRDTMKANHANTTMRNVYFAHAIINELETFIDGFTPMLNESFAVKVRVGNAEIDVIGSDMASKMLKLNMISTPVILDDSETINVKTSLEELQEPGTSTEDKVKIMNSLAAEFDQDGTKLLSTIIDGNVITETNFQGKATAIEQQQRPATVIALNIGNTDVVFHSYNDFQEGEERRWYAKIGGVVYGQDEIVKNIPNFELSKSQVMSINDMLTALNKSIGEEELTAMKQSEYFKYAPVYDSTTVEEMTNNLNELGQIRDSTGLRYTTEDDRFLTDPAIEIASEFLQYIPDDPELAGEWLLTKSKENKSDLYRLVARSLYYRYYAPKPYYVTEVDPITGKKVRKQHTSMYYKAFKTGDIVALDALISATSQIRSTALENRAMAKDGKLIETKIQDRTDFYRIAASMDTSKGKITTGQFIADESLANRYKVTFLPDGKVKIRYYESDKDVKNNNAFVTFTMTQNPKALGTFKVSTDKSLTVREIQKIASQAGIHPTLLQDNFISKLNEYGERGGFKALDFIGTMIAIKLANVTVDGEYVNNFSLFTPNPNGVVKYTMSENTTKFHNIVRAVLTEVGASKVRAKTKGADGGDYSATVIINKGKRIQSEVHRAKKLAEKNGDTYLYSDNYFVDGILEFTDNEIAQGGTQLGWEGKANDELDELEKARFLIDVASLQKAAATKFKETFVQPGAMSDRTRVGIRGTRFKNPSHEFFPVEKGRLNTTKLRRFYTDNMISTYNRISDSVTNQMRSYLMDLRDGATSEAFMTQELREDLIASKLEDIQTIEDVYLILRRLRLPYDAVFKYSGLIEGAAMVKAPDGSVTIKPSLIQMHNLINSPDKSNLNFLIDMSLQDMKAYLSSIGYTMSYEAKKIMQDRFPKMNESELENALIEAYFYQNGMLEMQSIQLATGDVMAYGNKAPKNILQGSFFEQFIGKEEGMNELEEKKKGNKNKYILQEINKQKLPNGKTLADISIEELNDLGSEYNRAKFMKAILTANITNEAKVKLLMYDDLMTQLSPMYVDRVKRNQVLGTSGYTYVYAKENRPGAFLDRETNTIAIDNPKVEVYSLGSGHASVDAFDGEMIVSPEYAYKHNNSLGNKFSNFRARGPIKAVNGSTDENGNTIYEKFAAFPMFNWEIMQFATPEHQALMRRMMNAIQFEDKAINPTTKSLENQFNGLYMLREPLLSESDPNNQIWEDISAEEVLKHGEYLGEVKVTDTDGNTKTTTVAELLYDLRHGIINEDQLRGFTYQTNKVLIPDINNKADIFDYYGGIEGNKKMLNSIKSEAEKKKFMEEFPFGWVEYQVMQVMSNYRGLNGNYPIRNASINKVVFKRTTKTGQQHMNSADVVYGEGVEGITHFPVSNEYAGTVLMPEHDPDTTGEWNIVEEVHNNMLTMMSQVNSASTAQGNTMQHTSALFNALGDISNNQLKKIDAEIKQIEERQRAEGITDVPATKEYIVNLLRDVIKTRKDPGITGDMLAKEISEVSLDLKMLVRLVRSAVNAAVEKSTIKRKAKGGQFVLASVQNRVKYYDYGNATGLLRASVNVDLSRTDDRVDSQGNPVQNAIAKDNSVNGLLRVDIENRTVDEANAVLQDGWKVKPVTDIRHIRKFHTDADYVYIANKVTGKLEAKRLSELIRRDYVSRRAGTVNDDIEALIAEGRLYSPWLGGATHFAVVNSPEMVKATSSLTDALFEHSKNGVLFEIDLATGTAVPIDRGRVDFMPYIAKLAKENRLGISSNGQEGNDLKWINYEIDGKSLTEMDEYRSLKESAKLPKAVREIMAIEDEAMREEALKDMILNAPDGILARYYSEEVWGEYTPLQGPKMIEQGSTLLREAIANGSISIHDVAKWLATYGGLDNVGFTAKFKAQMNRMLEQEAGAAKPAEFYSPPMHQAAMLLEEGDSHQDVVSTDQQPDYHKLFSLTYTDPKTKNITKILTEVEEYTIETAWESDKGKQLKAKLQETAAVLTKAGDTEKANIIETFIQRRDNQQDHMKSFFEAKVDKIEKLAYDTEILSPLEKKGLKKRMPYYLLIREINKSIKDGKIVNRKALYNKLDSMLTELIEDDHIMGNDELLNSLMELKYIFDKGKNFNAFRKTLESRHKEFKKSWVITLANNYEKSLTFISARIPAQGKQSAVVGKVKNFIYTTRNTVYSPIEILAVSGADYDIDKQNNVTWDMSGNGKIIDWTEYVGEQSNPGSSLLNSRQEVLSLNFTKFEDDLKVKLADYKTKLGNIGYDSNKVDELAAKYEVRLREEMTKVVQNFTLHKLMQVYGSTANAVESSVMVIMNDLGVIKDFMDSFKITDKEIKSLKLKTDENGKIVEMTPELVRLIQTRQNANPFTPSTTMIYEKLNMDGKMGIAIYASALKGYLAAYYAWLQNDSVKIYNQKLNELTKDSFEGLDSIVLREDGSVDVEASVKKAGSSDIVDKLSSEAVFNQSREHEFIKFKTNEEVATALADDPLTKEFAPREGNLAFVYKDPETGLFKVRNDLSTLANTKKHMVKTGAVYGRLASVQAKQAYKRLVNATSVEEEYEILENFMNQFNLADNFDQEPQAWKDLSDLLSAATDNAKELILGKIGSNNTTSSIIATMVAIGFELKYALPIINDPLVQAAVKAYEADRRLLPDRKSDVKESFRVKLLSAIDEYTDPQKKLEQNVASDEQLREDIIKTYMAENKGKVPEDNVVDQLLEQQKALRRIYNPARQVLSMVKGANELTQLSGTLKINTGMVNGEVDTINYVKQVEKALGWVEGKDGKTVKVTLDMFLEAIDDHYDNNNSTMLYKIFRAADAKKSIFNIPYIIFKNGYYVSYLRSLNESNKMLEKSSFKIRLIKQFFTDQLPNHVYRVEDRDFNEFVNNLDSALINKYYQEKGKLLVGVSSYTTNSGHAHFDLSLSQQQDPKEAPGRMEFVKETARVLDSVIAKHPEIGELSLIKAINKGNIELDKATGERFQILSGINTNYYSLGQIDEFKFQLRRLKTSENADLRNLYNVLFHYSLIIDKSGLNRNSISTLFPAEEYDDYSNFLNETGKTDWLAQFFNKFKSKGAESLLLAPVKAPQVSTTSDSYEVNSRVFGKTKEGRNLDEVGDENVPDDMNHDAGDEADYSVLNMEEQAELDSQLEFGQLSLEKAEKWSNMYDTSTLDTIYRNGYHFTTSVVRSGTNGLLYAYYPGKDIGYVPVFKLSTMDAGMVEVDLKGSYGLNNIRKLGYDWGWQINVGVGIKGRLLKYNSATGNYWVLKEDASGKRRVTQMSAKDLINHNPGLSLYKNAIKYADTKYTEKDTIAVFVKSGGEKVPTKQKGAVTLLYKASDDLRYVTGDSYPIITDDLSDKLGKVVVKRNDFTYDEIMESDRFENAKNLTLYGLVRSLSKADQVKALEGISMGELYTAILNKASISKKAGVDPVVNEARSILQQIEDNKSIRYMFMRMPHKEKVKYLANKMGIEINEDAEYRFPTNKDIVNIKDAIDEMKNIESRGTIKADIDFLRNPNAVDEMTVADYMDFLKKKAKMTPEQYMKLTKIDIIDTGDRLHTTKEAYQQMRKNAQESTKKEQRPIKLIAPISLRTTKLNKLNPVIMQKLGNFLNKRFNNTTVKALNTAEIKYIYGAKYAKANAFTYNGIVVINTDKSTVHTVFHEMGHLYLAELKENNIDLYKAIMDKLEGHPDLVRIKEAYPELTGYDLKEELFVELLADYNSGALQAALENELVSGESEFGKVEEAFADIFGDFLGIDLNGMVTMDDSLATIMAKIGKDIIFNKNSALKSLSTNQRQDLETIVDPYSMTQKQMLQYLQEKGFIKTKCS